MTEQRRDGSRAPALDLATQVPRSPRERLGGLVHLGRMIDKARAKAAGTLGEYLYPCPLDQALLAWLGLDADEVLRTAAGRDDDEFSRWVREHATARTGDEIGRWNREFVARGPEDEEGRRRFLAKREALAPERTDLTSWVDLLDLEEGREVPTRSR